MKSFLYIHIKAASFFFAPKKEIMKRYIFIVEKFQKYIDDFIEGLKKEPLPPKYRFSSLTYYRGWLLKGK
jgi:protein AbiQ